ncbi:hypothetical protein ACEOHC_003860 [Salmonella enterica]
MSNQQTPLAWHIKHELGYEDVVTEPTVAKSLEGNPSWTVVPLVPMAEQTP